MARFTETPEIQEGCAVENATLGPYTQLCTGTRLLHSTLGAYSYAERFCDIANATIGRFVNIASYARIGATDHPMHLACQHHMLYRSASYWDDVEDWADFFAARRARRVEIGHDVWIGHMAMVKPEVTVGHGAVIGAGAVVTRDVPPYAIVAGNPARKLRDRHPPAIAERLIALAWWDWDHARLRSALDDLRTLPAEAFLDRHGG
ncbi:MAG: chloramphenicol acetyltransferase [Pseudomonadota bacterium]